MLKKLAVVGALLIGVAALGASAAAPQAEKTAQAPPSYSKSPVDSPPTSDASRLGAVEHPDQGIAPDSSKSPDDQKPLGKRFMDFSLTDALLSAFTLALVVVGVVQGLLITRQIDLARQEFISTHRPRIKVRRLTIEPILDEDGALVFHYHVVNYGETPCTLYEHNQTIIYQAAYLLMGPLVNAIATGRTTDIRLEGGGFAKIAFREPNVGPRKIPSIMTGNTLVSVFGYVAYKDDAGTIRRTGFLREFDHTRRRFFPVASEPEYEYQD